MQKICVLITKPPHSDEGAERMCGISKRARERGMEVAVYLIGDGVLCAKKNQMGHVGQNIKTALANNIAVHAGANDLMARGLSEKQIEQGVEIIRDVEGVFIEDIMESANKVVSW